MPRLVGANWDGTAIRWQDIALNSPVVLTGLGLIYWAIPRTIKYFRQRDRLDSGDGIHIKLGPFNSLL
jgi:hypothetical protein